MNPRSLFPVVCFLCLAPATAQTRAMFTPFGTGCSGGATIPSLYSPKLPVIGREFVVAVTGVTPRTIGGLVFGVSNTQWGNIPLPMRLWQIGAPNCNLLVSLDGWVNLGTGTGTAYLQTTLPRDRSLVGLAFYNQFFAPDPTANVAGIAFSNGAKAVIGTCLCLPEENIAEKFNTDGMLDKEHSGGVWSGGKALPAQVGGTGRHGTFDHRIGIKLPGNVYVFNTDNMVIPATHTESGRAETVTNGIFEFGSMTVPKDVIVRFVGSTNAQIKVRGNANIIGSIECSGADSAYFLGATATGPTAKGQPGALGGPGGGRGGQGGDSCPNTGANVLYDGRNGSDVQLVAGHAYAAQAVGTGGKGSPHWPRSGRETTYCALSVFSGSTAAGGGGGGFVTQGKIGVLTSVPCGSGGSAPNSGGKAFNIGVLVPRTSGPNRSLDHYAVGGSGGGGGGSHALLSRSGIYSKWPSGSGAAGGGGVLAFRVGRTLNVGTTGILASRGGKGYVIDGVRRVGEPGDGLFNTPSPAGGGSGGTILLQVGIDTNFLGLVDCSGGKGGILDNTPTGQVNLRAKAAGGDGGPGYIRLETPVIPNPGRLGRTVPTVGMSNVGKLLDYDVKVTTQTKIYNTGLSFSPYFLRYVIDATVGGRQRVYSDDPGLKHPNFAGPASAGKPVVFRLQGTKIDQKSGSVVNRGPWRDNVRTSNPNSLGLDDVNSWRFQITYDRSSATAIVVNSVTVFYQR